MNAVQAIGLNGLIQPIASMLVQAHIKRHKNELKMVTRRVNWKAEFINMSINMSIAPKMNMVSVYIDYAA